MRHNNVCVWSVFVNSSGEWKLGSLEYVSPADGNPMPPIKVPPSLEVYDPPEKNDQSKLKASTKWYDEYEFLYQFYIIVSTFIQQLCRYVGIGLFSLGIV